LRSIDSPAKQAELAARIVREKKNRDRAPAEIRAHAPRWSASGTLFAYEVNGGQVTIKGRSPCRDVAARVPALHEALAQAKDDAAGQGREPGEVA
jgi:hypothetical protein